MQFRMQMIFEDNVQLHNTQLVSCTRLLIATVKSPQADNHPTSKTLAPRQAYTLLAEAHFLSHAANHRPFSFSHPLKKCYIRTYNAVTRFP